MQTTYYKNDYGISKYSVTKIIGTNGLPGQTVMQDQKNKKEGWCKNYNKMVTQLKNQKISIDCSLCFYSWSLL